MAVRLLAQELWKKVPSFVQSRMEGGAGLAMSNLLRHHFNEVGFRLATHGPHSLPSSFNVLESFMT